MLYDVCSLWEQRHKGIFWWCAELFHIHTHTPRTFFWHFQMGNEFFVCWYLLFMACSALLHSLSLSLSHSWNDKYHYVKINLWRNKFTFSPALVALLLVWLEMKCFSTYLVHFSLHLFFWDLYCCWYCLLWTMMVNKIKEVEEEEWEIKKGFFLVNSPSLS